MINIKKNNINLKYFLEKIYNINSVISLNEQININKDIYEPYTIIRIINIFYIEYYDEILDNKKIFVNIIKYIFKNYYNSEVMEDEIYKLLNEKITSKNYKIIDEIKKSNI